MKSPTPHPTAEASPILDHPMIFRDSRLQLVPPRDNAFTGFTSLSFQGRRNWKWETFFRPFLRIETKSVAVPPLFAEPDRCHQTGENFILNVIRHSADTLQITVQASEEVWMYLGPSGTHENYGGLVEQEFLVFWGNARWQTLEGSDIVCRVESSAAVFHAPGNTIEGGISGHRIRLHIGENRFAVAAGNDDEISALKQRALLACNRLPSGPHLGIPDLATTYNRAIWTIASSTFAPEGRCTRSFLGACKPAYTKGTWLWDTCFAVRGYARHDASACKDWLRTFMDHQSANGMLPGLVGPNIIADVTQVPLFAWAANAILNADDDDQDFRREACEAARRNNDWWMTLADPACGGLPVTQPISYDNSPLYDGLRIEGMKSRENLALPDIIAALIIDCDEIAIMAARLGDNALAQSMQERRTFLAETGHRVLYDTSAGYYFASRGGQRLDLKTGPALTAVIFAPDDVAQELVNTYLKAGSPAWPVHGISTVLTDEPSYDPGNFWRGAIWAPVNRLVIDALMRRGFPEAAERLRKETQSLIETSGRFHEVYSPVTGKGSRAQLMTGFGAGVYLDLLAIEV
jgi:hypothetical protein